MTLPQPYQTLTSSGSLPKCQCCGREPALLMGGPLSGVGYNYLCQYCSDRLWLAVEKEILAIREKA